MPEGGSTGRIFKYFPDELPGPSPYLSGDHFENSSRSRLPSGIWILHLILFLLTLLTTTAFGYALLASFRSGRGFNESLYFSALGWMVRGDRFAWPGLIYSLPVLTVLLAHEFGHYFACRWWRVKATLPFFGPSPTLLGTIGAFIWIRSPIYTRKGLFDIGVSGPVAGFIVLMPFLLTGVWLSHAAPVALNGPIHFGTPPLLRLIEHFRFPGVAPDRIALHPLAMAAWAGLLATAMNLLPVGQLDGGHILYAVFGARRHRAASLAMVLLLIVFGFFYKPWWIWAVLMFVLRRHPLIYDQEPLGRPRMILGAAALILLLFSFSVIPVRIS